MVPQKINRVIRCAGRQRGNTEADRTLLNVLEHAALTSYRTLRALPVIRHRFLRYYTDTSGRLFDFMLLWSIGGLMFSHSHSALLDAVVDAETRKQLAAFRFKSSKEQVDEAINSGLLAAATKILHSDFFTKPQGEVCTTEYKRVVDRNRERLTKKFPSILRELAVCESQTFVPVSEILPDFKRMKLSDPKAEEIMELAEELKEQRELSLLCTPKPTITHLENFKLALTHARLWLLRSQLPVCFGSSVTYDELRSRGAIEIDPIIYERAREHIPSVTETDLMLKTVAEHSEVEDTEEVYHLKREDFKGSSKWNIPGLPVCVPRGEKEKAVRFHSLREGMDDDDDVSQTVNMWEVHEVPRVVAQLQKLNPQSFARFSQSLI